MHEALNLTMPNHITLNWIVQNQTKACVVKSSCINKRGNRVQLKLTDTIFFFGSLSIILFWKPAVFSFSDREAPNLVDLLDQAILSHTIETVIC